METVGHLELGEYRFAYRTAGSGPDVVLIHGWISSGRVWSNLMAHLAPHFRLWALDLIGFGDSRCADPTRTLTVGDQTRLVTAFCKAAGIHPYAVIGHSMGGTITLQLALDYPELMDRIVAISPVVSGKVGLNLHTILPTMWGRGFFAVGRVLWHRAKPYVPGGWWIRSASIAYPYLDLETVERTMEDFHKSTWGALYGGAISLLRANLEQRLHEIRKPALIITGDCDDTVPPAESHLAAGLIPGAHFVEIRQCHHHVMDEQPDQTASAVEAFLLDPAPVVPVKEGSSYA